ncbi:hypothetical protein [Roseateles sp. BYS87W]|uniref:Secreted protein n=1 Tax=Pelomonas baiyunensis TaxID=3299026 RepID=A0ABW7GVG5_9BURK
MHSIRHLILASLGCAATVAGLGLARPAHAASADPLRLQFERERAACITGQTRQPRDVCLKEASAAYAQLRRGQLAAQGHGPAQWARNALLRCQAQPAEDRDLCERRVREGEVTGSVEAGGQLQSLTVRSTAATSDRPAGS